ncbi:helix-turn-helix transcriptional regulator [Promicromonospora sp. AC04]|uniref:helix-turn-helix transcriptional regulator n=1 Tax=Promicromonospora sp. AC04 TaxID=2135723 RepID=UPI000D3C7163|nr:helix-turn-helix transcriptional regulator [Promicromonospora sp. AC04]
MPSEERIKSFYLDLGQRVRAGRARTKMSQADLATRLGLTRASIANLEAGRQHPAAHQAAMIAEVLEIPIQDLLAAAPHAVDPTETQHAALRKWARSQAKTDTEETS